MHGVGSFYMLWCALRKCRREEVLEDQCRFRKGKGTSIKSKGVLEVNKDLCTVRILRVGVWGTKWDKKGR